MKIKVGCNMFVRSSGTEEWVRVGDAVDIEISASNMRGVMIIEREFSPDYKVRGIKLIREMLNLSLLHAVRIYELAIELNKKGFVPY